MKKQDFHEMIMEYFLNKNLDEYIKTMEKYHKDKTFFKNDI